ncbi:MAG TPA: ABC transporter ATP-binding protein [Gammaproteobacteria bacterium]|nr:ABC transporter ATP-binding protein [Gammaproteobacteria bacterium]
MIRLEQVQRVFQVGDQAVHALDGVDLTIEPGEYVSIMGPSGSGKSTLLNILGLLDRPDAGRYLLEGRDVTGLTDAEQARVRRNQIGFVFQFFHLIPRMTAAENVELPLVLEGVEPAERRRRVDKVLAAVGLSDRARHRPDQLSGGQRQRVAIARATILEPTLLLTDEPTGNLDRASGLDIIEVLEALHEHGITLIIVTHDPDLGGRAHRRLHMVDGRIVGDERGGGHHED